MSARSVYLGLGSNLGDRAQHLSRAVQLLGRELGSPVATSFLYQTTPAYVTDQPAFLNAVARVTTALSLEDLLRCVKRIETLVGRQPTFRNGPRILDVDILCMSGLLLRVLTVIVCPCDF